MEYNMIFCDDGCTQPLACKRLSNVKYVLVKFSVHGFGDVGAPETIISEEFDDIEIYNDYYSPAYIFVKKNHLWGMYRYSISVDIYEKHFRDLCGRVLIKKEKFNYTCIDELKKKYIRGDYGSRDG